MPNWTDDQKKVIELRDRNILVSAGAGSGKTAVLVQRIIEIITDPDKPVNIDQLVVVTFTNAAAAEMRERIGKAIQKGLLDDPENEHLQKQQALLHNAHISTIDSFCLFIVQNYFNEIGLSPDFRMGDEGELVLLMKDVLSELLEEEYQAGDDEFLNLVECMSPGKNDKKIEDLVFKLYKFSMSHPDSKGWLKQCADRYSISQVQELDNNEFISLALDYTEKILNDLSTRLDTALNICNSSEGPIAYGETILSDKDKLEGLLRCKCYADYYESLKDFKLDNLSRKRQPEASEIKKDQVKNLRDSVKKEIGKLKEDFFSQSPEEIIELSKGVGILARAICNLTIKFIDKYKDSKLQKKVVDFSDIEHFALDILTGKDKEGRSQVAEQLSSVFYEIFIDEYQDSNQVQEEILRRVSGEFDGRNNVFMVGDVKQSIYRFRMADPTLFMDKYQTYTIQDSPLQKVDLHANFRSRYQVLNAVNYMFDQLMHGDGVGEVEYDQAARLIPEAKYPEGQGYNTEFMMITHMEEEE